MKKSTREALSTVTVADATCAAINMLLHSIRFYARNLRPENMKAASAYYDTTVSEWLKTPTELELIFQTVQAGGVRSEADSYLVEFMTRIASIVSCTCVKASLQSPSPSSTSVRFESGAVKLESADAVTMRQTIRLTGIEHPVIFTTLGWGTYVIQNLTVSAQCCQSSNKLAQFIRKHARLLTQASDPASWFMREEEHQTFWDDLRALMRIAEETPEGKELMRGYIGELNGRHAYPDIHGFVNEQTTLLDVSGNDSDLCVARHKRADGAYATGSFPALTSVVASWVTFCMCDPLVFFSAFAQIHAPMFDQDGEAIEPELALSKVDLPYADEWELPESYSIRHAAR